MIRSDAGAISTADPNDDLEHMKTIVRTANAEGKAIPFREVIPFWFAISQPVARYASGFIGKRGLLRG